MRPHRATAALNAISRSGVQQSATGDELLLDREAVACSDLQDKIVLMISDRGDEEPPPAGSG